ncbi:tetratricopeptide repeat protein [Microbulbifer thermotolerans]|uniref:Tetratricopeptide repeat-containing protein n=2 Tax=Microbulbifer thermotolerans TaxID=252514 RepID=A0AB35HYU5_MICTH|nr:hypothetical protein [Microbulbifer thermotolerans]MCX2779047.1 hypothetical protein [Microbulbifer thermotolerans]MCX2802076.1 hypothetical protein [Microbulbifer thermotolerans]MCX2804656.1 hypothetical protein [Microbulbifer thermotolerans]
MIKQKISNFTLVVVFILISCGKSLTQDELYKKYLSCYESENYDCSLNYISLMIEKDPNNIFLRRERADVYMNLSNPDMAILDVKYTIDNDLAYSEDYLLLFDIYRFLGRGKEAEKILLSGIKKAKERMPFTPLHVDSVNPGEEELFLNLYRFYINMGEEEKACEIAEDGFRRNSASIDLRDVTSNCGAEREQ